MGRYRVGSTTGTSVLAGCMLLGVSLAGRASDVGYAGAPYPWDPPAPSIAFDARTLLPKLSTLGQGIEYRHSYSSQFGMRLESFEFQNERAETNGLLQGQRHIKLSSQSVLFDWFPFEGRFRATTGVYFIRGELSASANYGALHTGATTFSAQQVNEAAQSLAEALSQKGYLEYARQINQFAASNNENFSIDGQTVSLRDLVVISARVGLPRYAPYLGFGWANVADTRGGLFYSIDAGLMYLGHLRVEYSVTGSLLDALPAEYRPQLDALIAEEERQAEEQLRRYRYYPVVSIGFGYRF